MNETKCLECGTVTAREEAFYDLSLDIEQNCSLTACLRNFRCGARRLPRAAQAWKISCINMSKAGVLWSAMRLRVGFATAKTVLRLKMR